MEFRTRSKEEVLTDLTTKLGDLPLKHPDRPTLVRMIVSLRTELASTDPAGNLRRPTEQPEWRGQRG